MGIKTKRCVFPQPSAVKEILIPENELCDVWVNWEVGVRDFILSRINKNTYFIDVGANIGYFSLWAATKAKQVFAIEPNPPVFEVLKSNIQDVANIFAHNIALSVNNHDNRFYWRDLAHGDGRLYNPKEINPYDGNAYESKLMVSLTLSGFQKNYCENHKIDFIKMDCEGSEYEILHDQSFFRKNIGCEIMLELHGTMIRDRGLDYNQFRKYLLSKFKIFNLTGTPLNSWDDIPIRGHIYLKSVL